MNKSDIPKIASELEKARKQVSNLKTADMVRLAKRLERYEAKSRSGHFVYKSPLEGRRPFIITNHPGQPIGRGLASSQLTFLEGDLEAWEEWLKVNEGGGA